MSLRDTIEGARDEAEANIGQLTKKSKDAKAAKDDDKEVAAYDPFAAGKSSAANARPKAEAGASVRTEGSVKKSTIPLTKEEKKEARRKERELEDARNRAYDILTHSDPEYKKTDRVWWVLIGVGFACTILSLIMAYVFNNNGGSTFDTSTTAGLVSVVALVLAYVFIIGAFVFDLVKRRPIRRAAEKRLQGMTDSRVADFLAKEDAAVVKAAAKDAKK